MLDAERYREEILQGNIRDEFDYWDRMSGYSILGDHRVRYNFRKAQAIMVRLGQYDLAASDILEVGAGMANVAMALCVAGAIPMKRYRCTECGDGYIRFLWDCWGIRADKAKMNRLPYADHLFDVVFLFDVLEHIRPEERAQSWRELDRVMRDSRRVFINNPAKRNPSHHHPDYDHGFGFKEMEELAGALGCHIGNIQYYSCDLYRGDQPNFYHFVEITNK